MRLLPHLALAALLLPLAGCHSAYIEADVMNHTTQPIQLLEVDYPSASFGTQNLAPGAIYHYRFKVLGSGPTKLLYTDASHKDHTSSGPAFKEGDEGRLTIDLTESGPTWKFQTHTNP
ncbi:hypothetical protein [Granulicella sibirica]|uniref:Uncharacterized protein n=1 Tax=Granulicella sibirica TaxID=2479048 RepID=A0A4Q0T3I9_9BACT|nr:hypothetical protein [Granulicella sibirica]RXH56578.1 hypothetical protein GRAN_3435 [Granulicella sibirica]